MPRLPMGANLPASTTACASAFVFTWEEIAGPRQVAQVGIVHAPVLALEPDPVGAQRPQLIDEVGVVGAGEDGRHMAGGETLLHAVLSDLHRGPFLAIRVRPARRRRASSSGSS